MSSELVQYIEPTGDEPIVDWMLEEGYKQTIEDLGYAAYAMGRPYQHYEAKANDGKPIYRDVINGNVLKDFNQPGLGITEWDGTTGYYDPIQAVQEAFGVISYIRREP